MGYLDRLKKQSSESVDKFKKFAEQNNGKSSGGDKTYWKPKIGADGNAKIKIRFLPPHEEETSPYVFYFNHFIRKDGKIFAEKCPQTHGWDHKCPVCSHMQPLWDGTESEKKVASARGRKKNFVANILVIDEENAPENNGRVFKWRFGVSIQEKITKAMEPDDAEDTIISPFDLFDEGANFLIKIKQKGDYPNYDDSKFLEKGALKVNDEKLEEIVNSIHKIEPLIDPSEFKDYATLEAEYAKVVGDYHPGRIESAPEPEKESAKKTTTTTTSGGKAFDGDDDDDVPFDGGRKITKETVVENVDEIDFSTVNFD